MLLSTLLLSVLSVNLSNIEINFRESLELNLAQLVEKGSDSDLLQEKIGHVA